MTGNSSAGTSNGRKGRGVSWRLQETLNLLEIWGEQKIQDQLRNSHQNIDFFEYIAQKMATRGHRRTALECRSKTKVMRLEYKRVIDHNSKAGSSKVTCPFYEQLHHILQGNASMKPSRVGRTLSFHLVPQPEAAQEQPQPAVEETIPPDVHVVNVGEYLKQEDADDAGVVTGDGTEEDMAEAGENDMAAMKEEDGNEGSGRDLDYQRPRVNQRSPIHQDAPVNTGISTSSSGVPASRRHPQAPTNKTPPIRMMKQKRLAYKIPFKLEVVKYAKEHGNRAAERHFAPPLTEKMIREWRKQEDQLQKADKSKHTFRGHAAKWPQLDIAMTKWITNHRNNGFSVSRKMIIYEAKRIAAEKGIHDFTGSPSWCYRFMKRCGLAMRTKTRIAQKMPEEYESKILYFHKFVIDARKRNGFEIGQIGNMAEVLLTFDVPSNRTVDPKGAKTITVKTSGYEKTHFKVVLSCCADGTKLPPMLIFKRKTFPKEVIPRGVVVHVHEKGWMDENGMRVWVEKVWSKRPGGLLKKPALLVLDQFRAHISETTKKCFKDVKTHLAVIPGGLTSQLQPLDASINKPFKVFMREEWNKWMAAGHRDLTGGMKRPTITQVCEWVKTSWHSVKEEIVVRSFKKCGISNAMDGNEDDILFEDSEESDVSDYEQLSFLNSDSNTDELLGFTED